MGVPFWRHGLGAAERAALAAATESLHLTTGPAAAAVESRLAEMTGAAHALALTSCTAGLHLGLLANGVGPGDEVITSPISFVATANVIHHTGAKAVFADVEAESGLLDPAAVAAAITPATKGILPVHLYGNMADMGALNALAAAHGLFVLEDAAHALESVGPLGPPGTGSAGAAFSFYATKSATCGEGGALVQSDPAAAALAKRLRLHGLDFSPALRGDAPYRHYDMVDLGHKCNLNDLLASLLLPQLSSERCAARVDARRQAYAAYDNALAGAPGVRPGPARQEGSACYLHTIRVEPALRDRFLAGLGAEGIGVAVNFRPIHLMAWYRDRLGLGPGAFPAAEALGAETITLPSHGRLTAEEIGAVAQAVRKVAADLA